MKYVEYPPHPHLSHVIECCWTVRGQCDSQFNVVFPDACMDMLFDFSDGAKVFTIGNMTRPIETKTMGWTDILGIRFHPGGISAFVKADLSCLTDESVLLSDVMTSHPSFEKLIVMSTGQRINFISNWLLKRLADFQKPDAWRHGVSQLMKSRGTISIVDLSKELKVSQKHLERQFKVNVGLTPKQLAMTLRFRHAKNYLDLRHARDLLQIAADLGFTDHAHFTHSFKAFSGLTPTQYLRQRKNY